MQINEVTLLSPSQSCSQKPLTKAHLSAGYRCVHLIRGKKTLQIERYSHSTRSNLVFVVLGPGPGPKVAISLTERYVQRPRDAKSPSTWELWVMANEVVTRRDAMAVCLTERTNKDRKVE